MKGEKYSYLIGGGRRKSGNMGGEAEWRGREIERSRLNGE
jgi:hypothetical protein